MFKRILLKLSGEAFLGALSFGVDGLVVERVGKEIDKALKKGIQVAVVVGGGNIFRGVSGVSEKGMKRPVADAMGMLATVMNALALKDGFETLGIKTRVLSAIQMGNLIDNFQRDRAIESLENGELLLLPGGTSNPFFTTDSAAVLRALETECDIVLKATKVDGVYSADPVKDSSAVRYSKLSYDEALSKKLKIMDQSAFSLASEGNLPIGVFDMTKEGNITKALLGEKIGTIVAN